MIEIAEAYGFRFAVPSGDLAVGKCLRTYGEFGRAGSTLVAQLATGATCIDVGANLGAYALPVSRRAARVIAIEAQPAIAELLARNVAENGVGNVEVIAAAAGAEAGTIAFPAPGLDDTLNFGGVGLGSWRGATAEIAMVRLDDLAPADTRVVKIDVEGYEEQVLAGAPNLLETVRPYWMAELGREGPRGRRLLESFWRWDYRTYWFYDPFVTPAAERGDWSQEPHGDFSVFAAPRTAGQPTGMVEATEGYAWPTGAKGFTYLRAFGFSQSLTG
jgi:FkbM family methyltransferase